MLTNIVQKLSGMQFGSEAHFLRQLVHIISMEDPTRVRHKPSDGLLNTKPCDLICCHDWESYYLELKYVPYDDYEHIYQHIRLTQRWALYKHKQAWWYSFIINYNKKTKNATIRDFHYLPEDENADGFHKGYTDVSKSRGRVLQSTTPEESYS
jgi:hypothetical protein